MKQTTPTEQEVDKAFENTNFGPVPKMHTLKFGLLKVASDYHNGHTAQCVLYELGLVGSSAEHQKLTARGRHCLWEWFESGYKDY